MGSVTLVNLISGLQSVRVTKRQRWCSNLRHYIPSHMSNLRNTGTNVCTTAMSNLLQDKRAVSRLENCSRTMTKCCGKLELEESTSRPSVWFVFSLLIFKGFLQRTSATRGLFWLGLMASVEFSKVGMQVIYAKSWRPICIRLHQRCIRHLFVMRMAYRLTVCSSNHEHLFIPLCRVRD